MIKRLCCILSITAAFLFITGCSDDENENNESSKAENTTEQETSEKSNDNANDKESDSKGTNTDAEQSATILEDVEPVPTKMAGFVSQTQGMFGDTSAYDNEKEVKKELKKLPQINENLSDKEMERFFSYIYWLVARDFPNPQDMIKKWEFGSFGNPDLPDARYQFKENYNVEVILDASGSMANYAGNKTRMQLAKESINEFLSNVPEEANVSLRVYGHKGTGSDSDKEMSCNAIEQVYGFSSYDKGNFQNSLDEFHPSGWTPIAGALKESQKAMKEFDAENNTNLIYLVSDGIGTCGGDPVKVAESFSDSQSKPIINIIGYQADVEAQKQLQNMADVSDGIYSTVNDPEGLEEEFNRAEKVLEAWEQWKEDALQDLDTMSVDNTVDIMELTNDWYSKTLAQGNNLNAAINLAEEAGVVTFDQEQKLLEMANSITDKLEQMDKEIESNLKDISTENIDKKKKEIKEKYNKQTEN